MKIENLEKLFVDELEDIYDAEHQVLDALPKMIDAAKDPELQQGFIRHLDQTRSQIQQLEKVFESLGEEPERKECKGMKGLIQEGERYLEAKGDADAIDAALIGAAQRVEHYEIASYGTLRTFAETLGRDKEAAILQRILEQESMTNEKLTAIAEKRVNRRATGGREGRGGAGASGLTKEELYERARELEIEGRSSMTKAELEEELARRG
jgi:ferritin-like metal-binding protein YciE